MTGSEEAIGAGCALAFLLIAVAAAIGYVLNIIKIFAAINDPITLGLGLRAIGVVFFPIGCIGGWL